VVAADVFIGVRFALAWRAIRSNQSGAFIQEEARLQQLESQMKHLSGLPQKVDAADGPRRSSMTCDWRRTTPPSCRNWVGGREKQREALTRCLRAECRSERG